MDAYRSEMQAKQHLIDYLEAENCELIIQNATLKADNDRLLAISRCLLYDGSAQEPSHKLAAQRRENEKQRQQLEELTQQLTNHDPVTVSRLHICAAFVAIWVAIATSLVVARLVFGWC